MAETWLLDRLLAEVRPGSADEWTWQQEYDDLWLDRDTRHMDMLATSMQETGQKTPVVVGDDGRLWDGHHRVAAAMRLGFETISVVRYDDMSEAEQMEHLLDSIGDWEDRQWRRGSVETYTATSGANPDAQPRDIGPN